MNTTTGALFDLDGVLIDSEGLYTGFWAGIGREFHHPSPTFAYDIKGTTLTHILSLFPEEVRHNIMERIHLFEDEIRYPIFPGVLEFLADLRNHGVCTAIVTSSDDTKMNYLFAQHPGLRDFFDAIVTGSMVTKSKPDPEGYLTAAYLIGVDPKEAYVFEDSLQGLSAGMSAGATVIGLATTNPSELIKDKAHKVIDGFIGFTYEDMVGVNR